MNCRFCNTIIHHQFTDLGSSPPSNALLDEENLNSPELYYPLRVLVCHHCFLVQIAEYKKAQEIFNESYPYFSSYSKTWLSHCKAYSKKIINDLKLTPNSLVIELASNDGCLLQFFKEKNIPVLGIEPSSNVAKVAQQKGIPSKIAYFTKKLGFQLAEQKINADLIIANNVLAHVPSLNDFVAGIGLILKDSGIVTMEFPHLLRLVEENQFDTIYHEHYSYFSFWTVKQIFEKHQLKIFDVEEIATHGGSLRIYGKKTTNHSIDTSLNVNRLLQKEINLGLNTLAYYLNFQQQVDKVKFNLLQFLIEKRENDKKCIAYGAAAKGNTLINYCGIKKNLIDYVIDISPHKQGKFLPGSHIPIVKEEILQKTKPDYILILPWNLKEEIMTQLAYVKDWGAKFIIPIPSLEVI